MNKKAADLTSHEIDLMAEALMKAFDATNPGHMYEAVSADFGGFFDIMGTLQDPTELNSNGDDEESLLRKSWSRHPCESFPVPFCAIEFGKSCQLTMAVKKGL